MDLKNVFLNGELNDEIYIEQQVGSLVKGQAKKVWKFKRSIYDLKQSSRKYLRFHKEVTSFDLTMINEDHFIYVIKSKANFVNLSLNMNDSLLAENNLEYVKMLSHGYQNYLIWKI